MDFKKLEESIKDAVVGNGINPLGSKFSDLKGVDPRTLPMGSECTMLQWLDDNTPYTFESIVTMKADSGEIGITAYKEDGSVFKAMRFPITGGTNGKVANQIAHDNRIIVQKIIEFLIG